MWPESLAFCNTEHFVLHGRLQAPKGEDGVETLEELHCMKMLEIFEHFKQLVMDRLLLLCKMIPSEFKKTFHFSSWQRASVSLRCDSRRNGLLAMHATLLAGCLVVKCCLEHVKIHLP